MPQERGHSLMMGVCSFVFEYWSDTERNKTIEMSDKFKMGDKQKATAMIKKKRRGQREKKEWKGEKRGCKG